ncbi:hypothetical protein V1L54_03550 [Streptomyces sp. TRM 70361]|uniref:hypothetical protein n=1 Tax=Streptomyces sp. TRM 70361 TaxID=3116553 RepID=UPI002E7C3C0C|nr:hypothetical protein [Streptomyces sp. TRM 70361]MEE1938495.1 hypothetical protein [Streptomyces sp. TRM 70361]
MQLEERSISAARLFDIRRVIGVLFVIYGVMVTLAGVFVSDADLAKAENININLWTGLAMLALGLFFLLWLRLSPTVPPPTAREDDGTGGDGGTGGDTAGPAAEGNRPPAGQ